jgi:hypothetical protein
MFSYLLVSTAPPPPHPALTPPALPIKLKLVLQLGGRLLGNSKTPRLIIMIGQSETGQPSDPIYYTLLWQVLGSVGPFTSLSKLGTL